MIGRYEVLRKIATGGMAELFLARQVGMGGFEKVVAIKRILSHLAHDEEFINMFRDEARIVAQLSHPNIVQIYDLGMADDSYFIAMEYISGRNMSSVAKRARAKGRSMPPTYVARCVAQACEGLHYAHTRQDMNGRPLGIVHRDVSPQNIICAFSGAVKLVDFGIAKAASKVAHTRAGVLKGKYAYMSPEQIRGNGTDARSDLFSVGIVLYELLCGRRPFEKENSIQTLRAIVREQPEDCQGLNPEIPDELAAVIRRCLEKDPDRRYGSAQEVQLDLEDVASLAGRVNNLTISEWVCDLFSEELSQDQGQTVMFPGLGRVVLPAMSELTPSDAAASAPLASPEPSSLADLSGVSQPARGGGSMAQAESGAGTPPPASLSEDDDETVHMAALGRAESSSAGEDPFEDSETEFGLKHQPRASSEVLHAVLDEHFADLPDEDADPDLDDETIASPQIAAPGFDEDDATVAMPAATPQASPELTEDPPAEPGKTRAYEASALGSQPELRHWFGAALDELESQDEDEDDDWTDKTTADPPSEWGGSASDPLGDAQVGVEDPAEQDRSGGIHAIPLRRIALDREPELPPAASRDLPAEHEANTVTGDPDNAAALDPSEAEDTVDRIPDATLPAFGKESLIGDDYSSLVGEEPRSGDLPEGGRGRSSLSAVLRRPETPSVEDGPRLHPADRIPAERPRPPPQLLKPAPVARRRLGLLAGVGFALAAALVAIGVLLFSQLRSQDVSLTITTEPPGALLTLDGVTHLERTPVEVTGLQVGENYRIQLELDGYQPHLEELVPNHSGALKLRVDMQPDPGL